MGAITLTRSRIQAGFYEAVLTGPVESEPQIQATHQGLVLEDIEVARNEQPNAWHLRVKIPSTVIGDGVSTVLISDKNSDEVLDQVSIVTGEEAESLLQSEVSLLRAELDLLKKAFRRHCLETEGR